jgi:mannose-6-phosphate isomerase-like protein (cupin superfamily)
MKPVTAPADRTKEFLTEERCWIVEAWNDPSDGAVSIARARVEPGVVTRPHRLNGVVERYVIVEGTGRVKVGDLPATEAGPGDVVIIPAGVAQSIENTGTGTLVFYCVCTPRFTPGCYEAVEG